MDRTSEANTEADVIMQQGSSSILLSYVHTMGSEREGRFRWCFSGSTMGPISWIIVVIMASLSIDHSLTSAASLNFANVFKFWACQSSDCIQSPNMVCDLELGRCICDQHPLHPKYRYELNPGTNLCVEELTEIGAIELIPEFETVETLTTSPSTEIATIALKCSGSGNGNASFVDSRLGACGSHDDCRIQRRIPYSSCNFDKCVCECDATDFRAFKGRPVKEVNGSCVLARGVGEFCSNSLECGPDHKLYSYRSLYEILYCVEGSCGCLTGHRWNAWSRICEPLPEPNPLPTYPVQPNPAECELDEDCEMSSKCDQRNKTCVSVESTESTPNVLEEMTVGCVGENCETNANLVVETVDKKIDQPDGTEKPSSSSIIWYIAIPAAAVTVTVIIAILAFRLRGSSRGHRRRRRPVENTKAPLLPMFMPPNIVHRGRRGRLRKISRLDFVVDEKNVLGSGKGGIVYKGTFGSISVAIKTLNPNCIRVDAYMESMCQEIEIFKALSEHPNIIKLLAYSYTAGNRIRGLPGYVDSYSSPTCHILMELCSLGSLLDFLRTNPYQARNEMEEDPATTTAAMTGYNDQHLLSIACQIAVGAEYLSGHGIVHGDLACRNVLLDVVGSSGQLVAKITDFGLAIKLGDSPIYKSGKDRFIPWKYSAPEVLVRREFSVQSDVWSFGVTLWEIFSRGAEPYDDGDWTPSFADDLYGGALRRLRPELASLDLYRLMERCWHSEPSNRPTFSEARAELDRLQNSNMVGEEAV